MEKLDINQQITSAGFKRAQLHLPTSLSQPPVLTHSARSSLQLAEQGGFHVLLPLLSRGFVTHLLICCSLADGWRRVLLPTGQAWSSRGHVLPTSPRQAQTPALVASRGCSSLARSPTSAGLLGGTGSRAAPRTRAGDSSERQLKDSS